MITKLQPSTALSIMNKYIVNNTTKLIQRKEFKCFLCNKQYREFFNAKEEKKYNYSHFDNGKSRFTSSSKLFTLTTTSQIEISFKNLQRLVEDQKVELKDIETFPELTNLLIKQLIELEINNGMKSIMWIYDRFGDDSDYNVLTHESKGLIIRELLKYKQREKAVMIMQKLLNDDNYTPESSLINELIDNLGRRSSNGYSNMNMMDKAEEYFNLMIEDNKITPTIEIFTTLINHHLRLLNIERSEQLFKTMKSYNIHPNIITYNAIINNSVIKFDMETAEKFFNEVIESDIQPDVATFSTLLKGYLNAGDTVRALQINEMMRKYGIIPNRTYITLLMKVYIQNKDLEQAEKVYTTMLEQPTTSGSSSSSSSQVANSDLIKSNIKSLTFHLKNLLQEARDKDYAYELYKNYLEKFDNYELKYTPDTYFFTIFISSFAQQFLDVGLAVELFEEMNRREIKPSIVTYTILIDGFALKGRADEAVEYFERMKKDSIEPNIYTYTSLIKAWVQVRRIDKVKEVYNEMVSKNIKPVSATLRALQKIRLDTQGDLIDKTPNSQKEAHYWGGKLWVSKDIETVDRLFQSFLLTMSNSFSTHDDYKPHVKTFRYFINCYLFKYENLTKALQVLQEMVKLNIKPDYITYCCFIKGFCMLGQVEKSHSILEIMKNKCEELHKALMKIKREKGEY
ncbi:16713_t:CDS:2 [Funneliformis geosporum]|nr:16713_t:CDS:2 [Funneliformis geosporum]